MLDWYVQAFVHGEPHERRLTFSSAREAIEEGNRILQTSAPEEVAVYHRLYSNQASITFPSPIPATDISLKANHLEQQARAASHAG